MAKLSVSEITSAYENLFRTERLSETLSDVIHLIVKRIITYIVNFDLCGMKSSMRLSPSRF